ncbi:uncharacterized protein [Nicotiana tomentosiformis]|uniref:uncharacterized protein n=1 Tax=Nicotiana tomentosiformis TaxID=4098 RepID=UPI00388CCFF4
MTPQYQAPTVPPVGVVQPVVAAQAGDRPAMSSEALLRLDTFTKLFPVHFSDDGICQEVLERLYVDQTSWVTCSDLGAVLPANSIEVPPYHIERGLPQDYVVVDHVYSSCVVTIGSVETNVDLLLSYMIDFDVILGMDWHSTYHAILDCHAKTVTLAILGLPQIEWKGTLGHTTKRVISYVKSRHMAEKNYLAYLAHIRNYSVVVPSMDSVPLVYEFPDVFPADLPGMPPDRDIDCSIDLAPGTQPISIPPYCMGPSELKQIKRTITRIS